MCGICGKVNFDPGAKVDPRLITSMMDTITHRGPDEDGMHLSGNVGLGHRRLRIIDLTTGAQPMANEDGTVWVVYNGEIYNYKELRQFLLSRGHKLQSSSDTEVLVHLYEEYGDAFVSQLQGMFTFALWDEKKRLLLLARDRVGIKPLYYCVTRNSLLFASEVKAILADESVPAEVEPAALDSFLTFYYVPGEQTLFRNIQKLSPGHYLTVSDGVVKLKQYWDLKMPEVPSSRSLDDSVETLRELLGQTVRDHMISDVPVGVLLSGGIDSTVVLSYAAEVGGDSLSAFTIGFGEDLSRDERLSARLVAKQYGIRHYETTITPGQFSDWLPSYVWHMEEPVCEPPAIALYFVSKLAREYVTVLLSGEGGDEAFAGYNTYRNIVWLERIKRALGPLAKSASHVAHTLGRIGGAQTLEHYGRLLGAPLEKYYYSRSSDPFAYFNANRAALYSGEFTAELGRNGHAPFTASLLESVRSNDTLAKLLYVDTKTWLPDDLLIKADKITMANSVELRVPLLDHRVLEFAASLPPSHKLHGFETKYVLKRAIADRVPRAILNRPKTGFPVPYAGWLRQELGSFVADILMDTRARNRGYFRPQTIEHLLKQHAAGRNYAKEIFSLLVLELWHRAFLDKPAGKSAPEAKPVAQAVSPGG